MSKGFTVRGQLDGALYEVQITGDRANPVVGSSLVTGLFRQYDGETVLATPQGPKYVVNGGDPASVLALLSAKSQVESVGGPEQAVPSLVESRDLGVIR